MKTRFCLLRAILAVIVLFAGSGALFAQYYITSTTPTSFLSNVTTNQTLTANGTSLPTLFGPGEYAYCFYTGYGASATPIIPGTATATSSVMVVPASTINSIPASAFVAGPFLASLTVIPYAGTSTTCTGGTSTASNTQNVVIAYSSGGGGGSGGGSLAITGESPSEIFATNPVTNLPSPPKSINISGTGFAAPTTVSFSWGSGSGNGTIIYESATSLQVSLPTIPAGVSSITPTVCNSGTTCVTGTAITVAALSTTSGTISATPNPSMVGVSTTISATVTGSATIGAPSGTASLSVNGQTATSAKLVLDPATGTFVAGGTGTLALSPSATPVIADFNGDGIPDMAYTDYASTIALHVLLGSTPAGSFQADTSSTNVTSGCYTVNQVVAGDFNGDGVSDVAVSCINVNGSEQVLVALGNGDGTFQNPNQLASPTGPFLLTGDMNHDGKLDLVVVNPSSGSGVGQFSVYLGNGDGTFTASTVTSFPLASGALPDFEIADIDGDGYPDFVAMNYVPSTTTGSIDIYRNQSNTLYGVSGGSGANTPTYSIGLQASTFAYQQLTLGDVNGDGLPDLVTDYAVTSSSTPEVGVTAYLNTSKPGSIAFQAGPNNTVPSVVTSFAAADFNGDGLADIALEIPCSSCSLPGSNVQVLTGDGTGNFAATYTNLQTTSNTVGTFFLASLNGNSYTDLLVMPTGEVSSIALTSYITSGKANVTLPYNPTTDGTNAIALSYPGDYNYTGTSLSLSLPVNGAAVTVGLGSSLATAQYGQPVTLTATVGSAYAGSPSGAVSFYDSGKLIGQSTIVSGTATLTLSSLGVGAHSITATYGGNTVYATGASTGSLPLTVTQATPTITTAPAASAITYGQTLASSTLSGGVASSSGTAVAGSFSFSAPTTAPAAGTASYAVTFTPTNATDYNTATTTVTVTTGKAQPVITTPPAASAITYGQTLASSTLSGGVASSSGTAVAGSFSFSAPTTAPAAGTASYAVTFTPTNATDYNTATTTVSVTTGKAQPVIQWTAPSAIVIGTPLSATQLNATATGPLGSVAGQFTYTPAAGTKLPAGAGQKLAVTFVPTDTVDYANGAGSTTITVIPLTLTQISPSSIPLGSAATTVVVTGEGFLPNSVVNVNGTATATTYVSGNSLSAVLSSTLLQKAQSLSITVTDPTQAEISNAVSIEVSAPAPAATFSGPSTAQSAQQPTLSFTLSSGYPTSLTGTLTLTFAGLGGVDDPSIQFATGGRTQTFTIPANSTVSPTIQLQTGTVAGTITVSLKLTAGGQDVTPSTITPVTITLPPAAPGITQASLSQSGDILTIQIIGYSNSREISSAAFDFTAVPGASLATSEIVVPVEKEFQSWFDNPASQQYGSQFKYKQTFVISGGASAVGSVTVTLTNATGASVSETIK